MLWERKPEIESNSHNTGFQSKAAGELWPATAEVSPGEAWASALDSDETPRIEIWPLEKGDASYLGDVLYLMYSTVTMSSCIPDSTAPTMHVQIPGGGVVCPCFFLGTWAFKLEVF